MRMYNMRRVWGILLAIVLCIGVCYTEPLEAYGAATDPFVIVLDPGHGGLDGGAVRTWSGKKYQEKLLNLAIAKYCKEELEQYVGVKVYLTRSSDTYVGLKQRVSYAKSKGADLFVSLHNNADILSSRKGACVFYPNGNYNRKVSVEGKTVARCIQNQLASLGLKNLGVSYRNSENRTRYPDKKLADYYSVIRESKLSGFPGIIVEHAYISNPSDCKTYLSSKAKLKKLGQADAAGIVEAYGLVKGGEPVLTTAENQQGEAVNLAWMETVGIEGYNVYRRIYGQKSYALLATIKDPSAVSYTDYSVEGGVTYEYCVRGFVKCKKVVRYTDASNVWMVTVLGAPERVIMDTASAEGTQIAFTPVEGASGYLVARSEPGAESYTVVAELGNDTLSWKDSDALAGKNWEYQVCAYVNVDEKRVEGAYTKAILGTIDLESGADIQSAQKSEVEIAPDKIE